MADFTVGDLRREIEGLPDHAKLEFGGGLTFSRLKREDDDDFTLEWAELYADLSEDAREHIVAFCRPQAPEGKVIFVDFRTPETQSST